MAMQLSRYVSGPGPDEPLVWYEGSDLASRRFLHADHQGSVIALSGSTGTPANINSYDEYAIAASSNAGRFQYTGQIWLPELGLYHYKARAYSPTLGRFLQTDPVGYTADLNLYAYVGNDPTDKTGPMGQFDCVQTGDHTLQYTGHGLADIAAMYVWKAGVESGIIAPPPTVSQNNGGSNNGGNSEPGTGHNGGPPMNGGNNSNNNNNQNGPGLPPPVVPPPSSDNAYPSTPTGTKQSPGDVKPGTNAPTSAERTILGTHKIKCRDVGFRRRLLKIRSTMVCLNPEIDPERRRIMTQRTTSRW